MTTETSNISSPRSEVEQANPQTCDSRPKRYLVQKPKEKPTGPRNGEDRDSEILLPAKYSPLKLKLKENSMATCEKFRVIGSGAQGEVIEAMLKEGHIERKVVLKRSDVSKFDNAKGKETKREWEMAVAIRHPNIVEFIEAFYSNEDKVPKFFYFVFEKMDYELAKYYESLQAKDLELSKAKGQPKMSPRDHAFFEALATQLLRAVDYLHNLGIMHRDLKPQNIGVNSKNFVVKLFDFGHSRYAATNHTHMRGTPSFNAPEVLLMQKYDTKADIWSLGITLLGFFGYNPHPKTIRDLLEMTLRITGTPKEPVHQSLKEFKKCKGMSGLKDLVPLLQLSSNRPTTAPVNAQVRALNQLFKEMLCFDPNERRSASQLLHGNYLQATNQKYDANDQNQCREQDLEIFIQMMKRQSYCANSTYGTDSEANSEPR